MTFALARPVPVPAVLLLGLGGAVALRLGIGGAAGVRDPLAGAAFAAVLTGFALLAGLRRAPARPLSSVPAGLGGAAVLCVVPLVVHLRSGAPPLPAGGFAGWAVVVSAVAVGEEALLRGALWEALAAWRGEWVALGVSTVAFGLLHVPLYGGSVLVLDLVVGLLLGGVRMVSAGWGGPAVAHTVADLAGWWLR